MTVGSLPSSVGAMYIDLATDRGDVTIQEHELLTITDDDLAMLGISREDLLRCFEEGRQLMRGKTAADRVRPIAERTLDGRWVVHLMRYSGRATPS